jgi:DNA-binding response OmpR family regulator
MIEIKKLLKQTKNLTVLYVEDDKDLLSSTSEMLQNYFSVVGSAINGEDALIKFDAYYQKNDINYDLIITELEMPKLDGIDCIKEIYQRNSSQAIIVLSAYQTSEYLLPLINLGIEQFLVKPLEFNKLHEVLYNCCKKINVLKNSFNTNMLNDDFVFNENVVYNRKERILSESGSSIKLTRNEASFLQLITNGSEKIITNGDIVTYFNESGNNINPENIRNMVSKLRKKLPDYSVESVYGIGYKVHSH